MRAKTDESPGIDVAEAVAAVKRDLIGELDPRPRHSARHGLRRPDWHDRRPPDARRPDRRRVAGRAHDRRARRVWAPGPIRKILTHLGEPLEPPPISPARGPPTDWGELVQLHDDRDVFQSSPDELPTIDIHSL
jgi:hypothetical protein